MRRQRGQKRQRAEASSGGIRLFAQVGVRLPAELAVRLKRYSQESGESLNRAVALALEAYLTAKRY